MAKFTVTTTKTRTIRYRLTYEIEAEDEKQACQEIRTGGYTPIEEEFYDEKENEELFDVEYLED